MSAPIWMKAREVFASKHLDGKGRHLIKIALLVLTCITLGYTLSSLWASDMRFHTSRIGLPAGMQLSPAKGEHAISSANGTGASDDDAYFDPDLETTFDEGLEEELLKPDRPGGRRSKVGKVTILFGEDNAVYERALATHHLHNQRHGYTMHVLRNKVMGGLWSKPAYILYLLLREMTKDPNDRMRWLFWTDRDTVMMNPNVPIETFLPPEDFDHIHILLTDDWNGLNNGVFPLRVCQWSVDLMTAVVAFPTYRPDVKLRFTEQSALEEVMKEPKFRKHGLHIPQRWFNAYQAHELNETSQPYELRRGDMLLHFAGVGNRKERMRHWMDIIDDHLPEWEVDLKHTSYPSEVKEFWSEQRMKLRNEGEATEEAVKQAKGLITKLERNMREMKDELSTDEAKEIVNRMEKLKKLTEEDEKTRDVISIKEATEELRGAVGKVMQAMDKNLKDLHKKAHDTIHRIEKDLDKITDSKYSTDKTSMEGTISHLRKMLVEDPDNDENITKVLTTLNNKFDKIKDEAIPTAASKSKDKDSSSTGSKSSSGSSDSESRSEAGEAKQN